MFMGHIASFKIEVSKVQDFGNFELSPMLIWPDLRLNLSALLSHLADTSSKINCILNL